MESNVSLQYPHCGGRLQVGSKKIEKKGLAVAVTGLIDPKDQPTGVATPNIS
jgi:hypothetical protein